MRIWITSLTLAAYSALMVDLTLIRFHQANPGWNLVPLRTIAHDFRVGGPEFLINTVGNMVAFLPVGVLIPLVWPRPGWSARRIALVSFGLSLAIELAQAIQGRRVADVDDLLLNTIGGLAGYGLLTASRLAIRKRSGSSTRGVSTGAASKTRPLDPP